MSEFKVDEIEAISFDENGKEDGTWKGFSVVKKGDEANYCFDMRDKTNADMLCDFLNSECIIDSETSIEAYVLDNCIEWDNLLSELSHKELSLAILKDKYSDKEFKIVFQSDIDFKALYGSTSEKVRKQHAANELSDLNDKIKGLELSIDYLKRRIGFLRSLVNTKTVIMNVKNSCCDCED